MRAPSPPEPPPAWHQCNTAGAATAALVVLAACQALWTLAGGPFGENAFFVRVALALAWSVALAAAGFSLGARATQTVVAVTASPSNELVFSVNGVERRLFNPSPSLLLSEYLRGIGLTSAKVACGEGGCGACSVIAVGVDGVPRAINACLRLLCGCDGLAITTSEGLGSQSAGFSAVQQVIAKAGGSQCGFCTPGWVMAMSALLARYRGKILTAAAIERSLDGNLCRCTGYRPIVEAFTTAFADIEDCVPCHDIRTRAACGRACDKRWDPKHHERAETRAASREQAARAVAAPISVRARAAGPVLPLSYSDEATCLVYLRPASLAELTAALESHPCAALVCGNTGLGVRKYYMPQGPTGAAAQPAQRNATLLDISGIPEVTTISTDAEGVMTVGAGVSLEALRQALLAAADSDAASAPLASSLARHIARIANTQVRSTGSWAGNLAMAAAAPEFVSDVATIFEGARARVSVLRFQRSAAAAMCRAFVGASGRPTAPLSMSVAEYLDLGAGGVGCGGGDSAGVAGLPVLLNVELPLRGIAALPSSLPPAGTQPQHIFSYSDKVSQRHANAHAIVNAAFTLTFDDDLKIISATAAIGGVTQRLLTPTAFTAALLGKSLPDVAAFLDSWVARLEGEARLAGIAPSQLHSVEYRLGLLRAFGYKLFLSALYSRGLLAPRLIPAVRDSLGAAEDRPVTQATQEIDVSDPTIAPVSLPLPKRDALLQASGEAKYTSDLFLPGGVTVGAGGTGAELPAGATLYGCFVSSAAGSAGHTLLSIDAEDAVQCPGYVRLVSAADFPNPAANRNAGAFTHTTPSYLMQVGDTVPCAYAHAALVLADTPAHARYAAKHVRLVLSPPPPSAPLAGPRSGLPSAASMSVGGRVSAGRFRAGVQRMQQDGTARRMGLPVAALDAATAAGKTVRDSGTFQVGSGGMRVGANGGEVADDEGGHWCVLVGRPPCVWKTRAAEEGGTVLEGRCIAGAQKHFFLETQSAVAIPGEDGRFVVWCGCQNLRRTQEQIARALGVKAGRVDVRMRRAGGAFGGKLNAHLPTAVVAAVAASIVKAPVYLHAERADDMAAGGGRAGMDASWSASVQPGGIITSVELSVVFDSGCADGAGGAGDLGMAVHWADNSYLHADFSCSGKVVHSANVGTTACRAPGVIQSICLHEHVLEAVAEAVGLPAETVRERNMYSTGDTTPFGLKLGSGGVNWLVPQLWAACKAEWDVEARRRDIDAFNAGSAFRKRGLCMMPIKYGVGLGGNDKSMPAIVRVLADDGSVVVSHAGCEMGQGIHVKVVQAVAYALSCPLEQVIVSDTSSTDAANGADTGGSIGSETCVAAALDACAKLSAALAPFRSSGAADWADAVRAAAAHGVNLCETGWFCKPAAAGQPAGFEFDYATQGVCYGEVEIDSLTGECCVRKLFVAMDQGVPLNPLVDIGQVEGALVMGLGYFLTEEVRYSGNGSQLTLGAWEYKPPALHDIPLELNVKFVKSANPSPAAVLGSKASGEPAMALGAACALAVRDAIRAARAEVGTTSAQLDLVMPLTVERIQLACWPAQSPSMANSCPLKNVR